MSHPASPPRRSPTPENQKVYMIDIVNELRFITSDEEPLSDAMLEQLMMNPIDISNENSRPRSTGDKEEAGSDKRTKQTTSDAIVKGDRTVKGHSMDNPLLEKCTNHRRQNHVATMLDHVISKLEDVDKENSKAQATRDTGIVGEPPGLIGPIIDPDNTPDSERKGHHKHTRSAPKPKPKPNPNPNQQQQYRLPLGPPPRQDDGDDGYKPLPLSTSNEPRPYDSLDKPPTRTFVPDPRIPENGADLTAHRHWAKSARNERYHQHFACVEHHVYAALTREQRNLVHRICICAPVKGNDAPVILAVNLYDPELKGMEELKAVIEPLVDELVDSGAAWAISSSTKRQVVLPVRFAHYIDCQARKGDSSSDTDSD